MEHVFDASWCWQRGCPVHEAPDWIVEAVNQRATLRAQRDELLAAAKAVIENETQRELDSDYPPSAVTVQTNTLWQLRDAIASVEKAQ